MSNTLIFALVSSIAFNLFSVTIIYFAREKIADMKGRIEVLEWQVKRRDWFIRELRILATELEDTEVTAMECPSCKELSFHKVATSGIESYECDRCHHFAQM